jgi:hypothetical protein
VKCTQGLKASLDIRRRHATVADGSFPAQLASGAPRMARPPVRLDVLFERRGQRGEGCDGEEVCPAVPGKNGLEAIRRGNAPEGKKAEIPSLKPCS